MESIIEFFKNIVGIFGFFIVLAIVLMLLSYLSGSNLIYKGQKDPVATPTSFLDFFWVIGYGFQKIFNPNGLKKKELKKELQKLETLVHPVDRFTVTDVEYNNILTQANNSLQLGLYTKTQMESKIIKKLIALNTKRTQRIQEIKGILNLS